MNASRQVSVERVIPADAQDIFDVLADPGQHPVIDGSGTVKGTLGSFERLGPGSKFGMRMRIGLPYPIRNEVVEFEEARLIAWRHFGGHIWRYTLEPVEGGTRVTETFDWNHARSRAYIEWLNWPERHQPNMAKTLERLEQHVVGGVAA